MKIYVTIPTFEKIQATQFRTIEELPKRIQPYIRKIEGITFLAVGRGRLTEIRPTDFI